MHILANKEASVYTIGSPTRKVIFENFNLLNFFYYELHLIIMSGPNFKYHLEIDRTWENLSV